MSSLDLSISIVSYNDSEFMKNFLNSIYSNTKRISFEVLVVNNGNKDNVVEMIRNEYPQVDLIVNDKNTYFTQATNQNLARAKGEFIVYLSSDTLICENSFFPMIELMKNDPTIGVVGPIIFDFSGNIHSPGQRFPTVFNTILELIGFHKRFLMNKLWLYRHYRNHDPYSSFQVDTVSGACLMTRRSVINSIGLLDENLIMFYDEHDFCKRARKSGFKVFHCGKAEIKHFGYGTCKNEPSSLINELMIDSCLFLHKKYYGEFGYVPILATVKLMQIAIKIKKMFNFKRY